MAYRFKLDKNAGKGFRRIAREQIELAVNELSSAETLPPGAIHASRKAVKRLRALLAAVSPAIGAKVAAAHDRSFRDIGRMLSARRDADVCLDTVAALEVRYGDEAKDILKPLRGHLEAAHSAALSGLDTEALHRIVGRFDQEGKALRKAAWSGKGIAPVIAGVAKSYRIGRNAVKVAFKSPTDERVHELRKAVQAHWRHMALLSRAWPEIFAARAVAAHELSQLLGDDHDLALLKLAAKKLDSPRRKAVVRLCRRRQKELRALAKPRAERLYAETERAFAERMSAYWMLSAKIASSKIADRDGITPSGGNAEQAEAGIAAKTPV